MTPSKNKNNYIHPKRDTHQLAVSVAKKLRVATSLKRRQPMNIYSYILPRIGLLIKQQELTTLLELFETFGYGGDRSIALLAYLQNSEVEA